MTQPKNIFAIGLLLISTTLAQSHTASAASSLPTVDLRYAVHQATINNTGYPYYNFSNIRYGAAPIGNRRFDAPVAPITINRTVNNGQQGVTCPKASPLWQLTTAQFLSGVPIANLTQIPPASSGLNPALLSLIPPPDSTTSEDCLFLDVVVPASIYDSHYARSKRGESTEHNGHHNTTGAAVIVWIFGGGYTEGSKGSDGNPAGLLARSRDDGGEGVIYVAMNYRLGLYGWLSGPTFQANGTANAGLYDQRLALEWVQKHIHLFGGDKNRVTVMGQSAGGGSIQHQITAYGGLKGKVPFQQAIIQSPGFFPLPGNNQQETTYLQTLQFASLISGRQITTLDQLRTLNATQLYQTNYAMTALSPYGTFTYGPSVDGKFVPKLPGELLLYGQFDKSVKVMTGHNLNEGQVFTSPFIQSDTAFRAWIAGTLPGATNATVNYITQVLYPPVFNGSYGYTTQVARTALLLSEFVFTCNTRYIATALKNKVYSYYFTVSPGLHGSDEAFTFYNGDAKAPSASIAFTLQDYITSFAMKGNPNEPGVPFFPLYGANATTTNIATTGLGSQVRDTTANSRCDWWQKSLYY